MLSRSEFCPKDRFELSVFCNLVTAITEEACGVLARTAYTTFIKEAEDFSVALAKPDGTFFAFPGRSGVPTAVALPMDDVLARITSWKPGDILLTNDPYLSGGMVTHTPDVTMIAPVFFEDQLVAFRWSFLHSSDVGGAVPGSLAASFTEVFQEGLRIPPTKLYQAGKLNEDLYNLIVTNVRVPDQLWGDLQAMVSAFHVAGDRLVALFTKYGLERANELIDECISYAEVKARAVIESIPDGVYSFVDYLDDDINSPHPVRICLALNKAGSEIHVDFSGTDPQVMAAINLATAGKKAHTWLTVGILQFLLTADPEIPVNGGVLRPISVHAPVGTIVHAVEPAALGGRAVSGIRVMDATFGALIQALPGQVPAAGSGQGLLPVISMPDMESGRRKVNILQPLIGGTGARPGVDGYDGTHYSLGFMKNTPIEVIETDMDVLVHSYGYVQDSGGAGEFRGGLGVGLRAEVTAADTTVAIRGMERTRFAPWGAFGGQCGGLTSKLRTNPGRPNELIHPKGSDFVRLSPGDLIEFATSGGGGYGEPLLRAPEKVAEDLAFGFVSKAQAEEIYGVVFKDGIDQVDLAATSKKRETIRQLRPYRSDLFTFCEARRAHEATWTVQAYDALGTILSTLPIYARPFAKQVLMDRVAALGEAPSSMSREFIWRLWKENEQTPCPSRSRNE